MALTSEDTMVSQLLHISLESLVFIIKTFKGLSLSFGIHSASWHDFMSIKSNAFLRKTERRFFEDRRRKPTPLLSRYTLWGRRKTLRRKEDQERGGYVDRYDSSLLFFLVLIVGLNVLDSLFTMIILECGGWEINPIVRSAIEVYGDQFWVWKFTIVSVNIVLLCLHSRFRYVDKILLWITILYLGIISYQVLLMKFHIFE
jgi:hypothetical protein